MEASQVRISLTAFIHFISVAGPQRETIVKATKKPEENAYDYYKALREKIVSIHKSNKSRKDLESYAKNIRFDDEKKVENYRLMIGGYLKFWGRKKVDWVKPPKIVWKYNRLEIRINPEVGLVYKDKGQEIVHIIKLYFKKESVLGKRGIDTILDLMYYNLTKEYKEKEVRVCLLDVSKGKCHIKDDEEIKHLSLLEAEADGFVSLWDKL